MKSILTLILAVFISTSANAVDDVASQAEKYLNAVTTMSADFQQVDSEGNIAGGKFYLQRPGKFRWEYDKRQPILIVSNGKKLMYHDKKLKELTYADLEDTLANFLAKKVIRFSGDVKLLSAKQDKGYAYITVTQKNKPEEGKLTLVFKQNPMQITGMEVTDQNGAVTKVSFVNSVFGANIAADNFKFKDPRYNNNVWEKN
jgi:chaperone LolA